MNSLKNSASLNADVLIIGSGLAGSIAALELSDKGYRVLVITKDDSASRWAQGGIVFPQKGDELELIEDTIKAGAGLNFRATVEKVVFDGVNLVQEYLIGRLKISFDRDANGNFDFAREAAHSKSRVLHSKDQSGAKIMQALDLEIQKSKNIRKMNGTLVDLLSSSRHDLRPQKVYESERCVGAFILDYESGNIIPCVAPVTILSTGGYSQIFKHATGPTTSRGDGIAAAHRVGARTLHMEYIQFHPTALFVPGHPRKLLTEALRGAGAKLLNLSGKSFVDELAPRDVVSRAIMNEISKTGPGSHVLLDLKPIKDIQKFPGVLATLAEVGLDPLSDLIPVVPAAHYTIGGVWTDLKAQSSVPGLLACGEVSCTGLHGANRLASMSLLECLVMGVEAAKSTLSCSKDIDFQPRSWAPETQVEDDELIHQDFQFLRQTMWNFVGLLRSEHRLRRAERVLSELRNEVEVFYKRSRLSDALVGLRHAVLVANLVLYSALRNRKSLGTHYLSASDEADH